MAETSKKKELEKGVPLSALKGEDRPLSASLPLSTLLDSPRVAEAKEQMKTVSQPQVAPAPPKFEAPKFDLPPPPSKVEQPKKIEQPKQPEQKLQYIDGTVFKRDFLYRSDLQLIDETFADGNWWTYKNLGQKSGIASGSLHQIMVRVRKAIPSILVKDLQSNGPPVRSHPVKMKIPDQILPMVKGVIDFERSEFNPQRKRRKTKPRTPVSMEKELFNDDKLNNLETDTSTIGSSAPEGYEVEGNEQQNTIGEVEALLSIKAEDVKGSILSKVIGDDMSIEDVKKAIALYKIKRAQKGASMGSISQLLEDDIITRRIRGDGGGAAAPTAANRMMDTVIDGLQMKLLINILGPGLFGDQSKSGGNQDMDVKSVLELMSYMNNLRGNNNKSDLEKLAELMSALKTFQGDAQTTQAGVRSGIDELKDYLKGIFEDKTTRDKQLETFDKKLDDLIRDRDKKETQEQFDSRIEDLKETVRTLTDRQDANKVDPISTFITLQESLGKMKNDSEERLSALRLEIEKQKNEAVQKELERLAERINDAARKSSEPDQTVSSIRAAVTDLITENLKKVANLGRTPEDIETKRMEQLKEIINPAIGTLKDTVLKPVGDGIGDAIRESMKRQAAQAQTPPTPTPTPSLVPTPAQVPAPHPPVAPAPPVEEKKKPTYFMP